MFEHNFRRLHAEDKVETSLLMPSMGHKVVYRELCKGRVGQEGLGLGGGRARGLGVGG